MNWRTLSILLLLTSTSCSKDGEERPNITATPIEIPEKPNIIIIMTDQERHTVHWPKGWAEKNLPSMERLKKHGLTFTRAYTAACECSPSRAVIETGEHFPINKVPQTPPPSDGMPDYEMLTNIGSLLSEQADYDVVWKGKWHLSMPLDKGNDWTEQDIANLEKQYDLKGWNPPDAGNAILALEPTPDGKPYDGLKTLGGGFANNDGRYVQGMTKGDAKQTPGFGESILDYISKVALTDPDKRQPFCLFISLVNPHDVWVYPNSWKDAGYKQEDFASLGIDLPSNHKDDLKTKPSVQLKARDAYNAEAPLKDRAAEVEYVNFYAHLHKVVDKHIVTILDALEHAGLLENTIIIRMADHGELGLSHGMREKAYTVYEEMTHIPLVISNPKMYPHPQTTDAFYCHLDMMPTLADLAGIPDAASYGKGLSIVPVLLDPTDSVQDSILFTYDDRFFLPADTPGSHIRAIREGDWVYAVYYSEDGSHFEYEMYNLKSDPGQLVNLLYGKVSANTLSEATRLHDKLKDKIDAAEALPKDFPWPKAPLAKG